MISKNILLILLSILYCFPIGCQSDLGNDFKLKIEIINNGASLSKTDVIFKDNYAYQVVDDSINAIFNLAEMWYLEPSANKTITLSSCEDFFQQGKEKTKSSIAASNDTSIINFVNALINPSYKLKEDSNGIIIWNDYFQYIIKDYDKLSEDQNNLIYSYDILAAYQKAIINPKLPPFPQIELSKILKQKKILPRSITVNMKMKTNEISMKVNYSMDLISEKEKSLIKSINK